ncbi:NADHubiquinone oxidoreductase 20 kD subunit protein [Halorhabdus tiamatea SARL4B]|uniref:NADHubiquinone oxidoreductase 20 kD subunit protein n=1 Tax=Halorhabdus tiamatea SARL4B TaxID=1033806 RepID=U2F731_9EURY|nr:NADH ubiquinone oxidoreductase [Halorhabdus tiamatea]ERJ05975.1 NADHubiquinone oxidoreductase 20 kD subunit protein [Halorhabdus tiamatea SARL4B]
MSAQTEADARNDDRTTVATVCLGGCSGCHMEFLNVDHGLVELVEDVDIVASHMIVDEKGVPEADVGIAEGVVTNEENVEVAEELRENCDTVVAWGDCAALRGIMSLRNYQDRDEMLEETFMGEADDESEVPFGDDEGVPELLEEARPLDEFIDVDVYVPGCPPDADVMKESLEALARGETPEIEGEKLQYD